MKNFEGVDAVKFGNLLRTYRKAHKFTQKKVSDYLGVERSTYAKYETADRSPEISYIIKLAILYNVTLDEFFDAFFSADSEMTSTVVAGNKSSEKIVAQVTEQEMSLIRYYRESLRKAEIISFAEKVYNQDSEIIQEMNSI
jgi:transcriptional regulator with XRE-family HTH domain